MGHYQVFANKKPNRFENIVLAIPEGEALTNFVKKIPSKNKESKFKSWALQAS
jgi:hypothetical protein